MQSYFLITKGLTLLFLQDVAMQSVLEHVSICHSISEQLGVGVTTAPKDPTPSLLALYEFEAKLQLGHPELHGLLERVTCIPSIEAKTLETMAALCMRTHNAGD